MNIRNIKFANIAVFALFSMVILATYFSIPSQTKAACDDEPSVSTSSATSVDDESATFNGSVYGNGCSTTVWFEYGTDTNMDMETSDISTGSGSRDISKKINDLEDNTTYYYRAVAENDEGISYGYRYSFKTSRPGSSSSNNTSSNNSNYNYTYSGSNTTLRTGSTEVNAITTGATDVKTTSVNLTALILNSSNDRASAWFEWGTSTGLGFITPPVSTSALPSVKHIHAITGLRPNTTYYFRAVVENSYWRNNGSILSFTTGGSVAPVVNTVYVTEVVSAPTDDAFIATSSSSAPTDNSKTNDTEVTKAPVSKKTSAISDKNPASLSSLLGANAIGAGGSFLPQTLFGWLILIILVLFAIHLLKSALLPKGNAPAPHNTGHSDAHGGHH